MKNSIYFPILFTFIAGVYYPFLIQDGYLGFHDSDLIYPTVGSFIAIYGGFIASLYWWYKNVWEKRNKK
jgi:hypothetical protein